MMLEDGCITNRPKGGESTTAGVVDNNDSRVKRDYCNVVEPKARLSNEPEASETAIRPSVAREVIIIIVVDGGGG